MEILRIFMSCTLAKTFTCKFKNEYVRTKLSKNR